MRTLYRAFLIKENDLKQNFESGFSDSYSLNIRLKQANPINLGLFILILGHKNMPKIGVSRIGNLK